MTGLAMALVDLSDSASGFAKAGLNLLGQGLLRRFCSMVHVIPLFVLMGQIAFNAGIAK